MAFFVLEGEYYMFSLTQKVMGVLFFVGVYFFYLFLIVTKVKIVLNMMFVEMININWVFSSWSSKNLKKLMVLLVGDFFWLEIFGAEGVKVSLKLRQDFLLEKVSFFKISIMFFFSVIIFLWF